MKKVCTLIAAMFALGFAQQALAKPTLEEMVGTWKWESFTIKVQKCEKTGVCAEVLSGPKNVGLQMIQSTLAASDAGFVGKVAHPQTGDTYNSRISMVNETTWHIDGCTTSNVCASGDFTRLK
ncbi:MAG TPA: DUF2147 domain-containing protein [Gallionellaceae bacterium]|jgi:uncharacterized protein (DUF2147 family)|nr:DUF2147 domain-containing protein [Gallionellaceae bacterium]HQS75924.1 DUF2147 domain-containing protein [Gallionellaceae bacterium]